jgi:hypothetical protein
MQRFDHDGFLLLTVTSMSDGFWILDRRATGTHVLLKRESIRPPTKVPLCPSFANTPALSEMLCVLHVIRKDAI